MSRTHPCHLAALRALVLALAVAASPVAAQELPFTHYTSDDPISPLPANGVTAIHQDEIGFLWIALSGAGVVRYDGRRMERFTMEDGLADVNVDGFAESADGHLWISGYTGLSVSERPLPDYRTHERVRFDTSYCGVRVYDGSVTGEAVAADPSGGVWVGTPDLGVLHYRCADAGAHVDTFRTTGEEVYAIARRRDGTVWASLSGGEMLRLHAGDRSGAAFREAPPAAATVTAIFEDGRGTLWAGTYDGRVQRLAGDAWQTVDASLGHWVRGIAEMPDDALWFGSAGGGLLRVRSDGVSTVGRREGLMSATVYGMGTDREGNLFVGQSQGLSKLPGDYPAFEYYTSASRGGVPPSLPASSVSDVLVDGPRTWVATPGGLVVDHEDGLETIDAEDGLPTNEIYAIGRDAEGTIWIGLNGPTTALHRAGARPPTVGTTETAALTIGGEPWQATTLRLFNVYAIRNLRLRKSAADTTTVPSTWFASYMKVACLIDGEWYSFRQDAGFPPTASGGAVVDDRGRVWVATDDRGLYRSRTPLYADTIRALHRRRPGERELGREVAAPVFEPAWTTDGGAPTDAVLTLTWHDGRLWLGTSAGLFVADPSLKQVRRVDGLPDAGVVALAPSAESVWVGTNDGLSEVDPDSLHVVRTLGQVDGMLNDETSFVNSVAAGSDGSVYFGSAKGLTVYRPHLERTNDAPPKVALRRFQFEDQPWGRNRFEAEFAALTFTRERAVRYQMRLADYEDEWSDPTAEGRIQMTNLPAVLVSRPYTLEVRAQNEDGVVSAAPMRYAFTVRPAWYATWWFLIAALAALSGGTFAAYRRHMRRERFRHEVESARNIQQKLQPSEPLADSGFEIAGACVPAYEVGGDHFDYRWIEPGRRALVLLVDVEGKRMEGAFQSAVVRGMIASVDEHVPLPEAVVGLNRMIYTTLSGETAVAAVLAVVDVERGVVELVNAGCESPYVVRPSGVFRRNSVGCPPLGKVRSARYRTIRIELEPDDAVVICSDGVTEARREDGSVYRSRFEEHLGTHKGASAKEDARRILEDVDLFVGAGRPTDDRTVIVIRRQAPERASRASSADA